MGNHSDGLEISEAAKVLGISIDAARKRVQRGALSGYKADGRWYVVLDKKDETSRTESETQSKTSPGHVQSGESELVTSLRDEISFLRKQLDERSEENRRKDHIIAALAQRIPELPEGSTQESGVDEFKQQVLEEVKREISATEQRIDERDAERERRLEQRDRKLMESLRSIQESKATEKRSWLPWRR